MWRTDQLAINYVDIACVAGADVGLIGRRELLRGRLRAGAVHAGSLGGRPGSRRLVRRPCSQGGDEEPGSKGQHRRCTARRGAVLVPRRERRQVRNAGVVDDDVDLPEGAGGVAVKLHDASFGFLAVLKLFNPCG